MTNYLSMKRIEFHIGILPNDSADFREYAVAINMTFPEEDHVEVKSEFDDPYGYYTIICTGSWLTYEAFASWPYLKSIEHFEDDN